MERRLPGLEKAMEGLRRAAQGTVLAGIQGADAAHDDGQTPPLVLIAAANEFGTKDPGGAPRIPPRPFLRTAFDRRRAIWGDLAKRAIVLREGAEVVLDMSQIRILGAVMVGDIQESLHTGPWTPNAPATIEKKKSDQPLIDTGRLVQSVRAAYEDEAGTTLL